MSIDPLTAALSLGAEIVGHLPHPDPEIRRCEYVRRLTRVVARLGAIAQWRVLTPVQVGRLEGAKAALAAISPTPPTSTP